MASITDIAIDHRSMNTGIAYAALAYIFWGLFPLYFKALAGVAPLEILMHRMLWSLAVVAVILAVRRQWSWVRTLGARPALLGRFVVSALLISLNWFVYIWAVNSGHVIDASLGYFITPLFNVLLGRFVFNERLRNAQWTAVALAAAGVVWLGWRTQHLPWIGLLLATSFAGYGLAKKTAPLGALEGLTLETMLLFPIATIALAWLAYHAQSAFVAGPDATRWLLIGAGPITAIPLLLFAAGARRIPLTTLGLLQYLSPTLQLLLGAWVYHEPFGGATLMGYALIWAALLLYAVDGAWQRRYRSAA